jgi:hypothetical protein
MDEILGGFLNTLLMSFVKLIKVQVDYWNVKCIQLLVYCLRLPFWVVRSRTRRATPARVGINGIHLKCRFHAFTKRLDVGAALHPGRTLQGPDKAKRPQCPARSPINSHLRLLFRFAIFDLFIIIITTSISISSLVRARSPSTNSRDGP